MNALKRRRGGPDDCPLWQLRVRLSGRDHYRHMHGNEAAADQALAAFVAEIEGAGLPPVSPATRFHVWAADWLARTKPGLSNITAENYASYLTQHINPAIGDKRLNRITLRDGLALQHALIARHKATSVHQILRLGRYILADAVDHGILASNPWRAIRQKTPAPARSSVLPPEHFGKFSRPTNDDSLIGDVIALAIATGLRRGELLALRWADIDLAGGKLTVAGALEIVGGKVRRKGTKTDAGHRTLALPAAAVARLAQSRLRATETAERLERPLDALPVFAAADGHSWCNPDSVSQAGRRALRAAGLDDSLHGLRHAHATALLSHGVNPSAVAARLGHADVATTLRFYGHVLPRDETQAIRILDDTL